TVSSPDDQRDLAAAAAHAVDEAWPTADPRGARRRHDTEHARAGVRSHQLAKRRAWMVAVAERGIEQPALPLITMAGPVGRGVHGPEVAHLHARSGERAGHDRRARAPSHTVRPHRQRTRRRAQDLAQHAGAALARRRRALEREHDGAFATALLTSAQVGQHRAEKWIDLIDAA